MIMFFPFLVILLCPKPLSVKTGEPQGVGVARPALGAPSGRRLEPKVSLQQHRHALQYGQRTPANALHGVYTLTHYEPRNIIVKANSELTDARLGERPDCA